MPSNMRDRIVKAIRSVTGGHVSTYGAIARAAGYPGAARQVVATLHRAFDLPWHRIVGAGGEIKLRGDSGAEQRFRLEAEGVTFRGRRVNMRIHEFHFKSLRKKQSRRKAKSGRASSAKRKASNR